MTLMTLPRSLVTLASAALLALAARAAGIFVRPGGTAIAVSPPLTAGAEHFALIAEGIEYGLSTLREDVLLAA